MLVCVCECVCACACVCMWMCVKVGRCVCVYVCKSDSRGKEVKKEKRGKKELMCEANQECSKQSS